MRHLVGWVSVMGLVAIINIVLSRLIKYCSSTDIDVDGKTDDLFGTSYSN